MDQKEFKESLIEGIKENFDERGVEGMSFNDRGGVDKLNGGYDGVVITPEGSNIGVTLNVDALFEAYENGATMEDVVAHAADMAINGFENQPEVDVTALTDYEQMKEKLVMEVVSTETNKDLLAKVPHKEVEDMSVVYRFELGSDDNGRATVLATNEMIAMMGITAEQLHADAVENAPKLKPAQITGMSEVMVEMMGVTVDELALIGMPAPENEQMYVATVPDKIHGAGVLAYQDFMDQAAERVGGDFFILPSSIHEIIVVPDNGEMNLKDLEDMVKEVNATQVSLADKLTDSVYHYDAQNKVFELGEKFVARQAERDADIDKDEKGSVLGDLKAKRDEVAKQPKKDAVEKAAKNKGGEAI